MIISVTNGKETYEIKMDSTFIDKNTLNPVTNVMLFNNDGEGMSLNEHSLFKMIDDYFKKYY